MARIEFDSAHCAGHTLCNATAPEVYQLDDNGYCHNPPAMVNESLREAAIAGADACPERVLRVLEDTED
jgi:ferredoxin